MTSGTFSFSVCFFIINIIQNHLKTLYFPALYDKLVPNLLYIKFNTYYVVKHSGGRKMVVKAIVGVRGIKTSNKRIFVGLRTSYKTFDVGSEKVGNDGVLSNQAIAEWARSIQNRFKDSVTVIEGGLVNTYRF